MGTALRRAGASGKRGPSSSQQAIATCPGTSTGAAPASMDPPNLPFRVPEPGSTPGWRRVGGRRCEQPACSLRRRSGTQAGLRRLVDSHQFFHQKLPWARHLVMHSTDRLARRRRRPRSRTCSAPAPNLPFSSLEGRTGTRSTSAHCKTWACASLDAPSARRGPRCVSAMTWPRPPARRKRRWNVCSGASTSSLTVPAPRQKRMPPAFWISVLLRPHSTSGPRVSGLYYGRPVMGGTTPGSRSPFLMRRERSFTTAASLHRPELHVLGLHFLRRRRSHFIDGVRPRCGGPGATHRFLRVAVTPRRRLKGGRGMFDRSRYDAIVVGARCAGAATAMLMARCGLEVLVIDRGQYGAVTISTHALMRGGSRNSTAGACCHGSWRPALPRCAAQPSTMATTCSRSMSGPVTASRRSMRRAGPCWTAHSWMPLGALGPRCDTNAP